MYLNNTKCVSHDLESFAVLINLYSKVNFMTTSSKINRLLGIAAAFTTISVIVVPKSQAATVTVLNFEGIADNANPAISINNFYNGGTSSNGRSGTNYGITFSSNALALALNTLSQTSSNTSRGGQGDPSSQLGGFFYQNGSEAFLNFATGFDTGFSFFYSAPFTPATINVYSGIEGAGNLLATLNLPTTNDGRVSGCDGFSAAYCPFVASGVGFTGIARSIGFVGTNQSVFDDITFGSVTAGGDTTAVPEPFTIVGTLVGASTAFRMRRRLKATNKL